jgi:hypothetical protein
LTTAKSVKPVVQQLNAKRLEVIIPKKHIVSIHEKAIPNKYAADQGDTSRRGNPFQDGLKGSEAGSGSETEDSDIYTPPEIPKETTNLGNKKQELQNEITSKQPKPGKDSALTSTDLGITYQDIKFDEDEIKTHAVAAPIILYKVT